MYVSFTFPVTTYLATSGPVPLELEFVQSYPKIPLQVLCPKHFEGRGGFIDMLLEDKHLNEMVK